MLYLTFYEVDWNDPSVCSIIIYNSCALRADIMSNGTHKCSARPLVSVVLIKGENSAKAIDPFSGYWFIQSMVAETLWTTVASIRSSFSCSISISKHWEEGWKNEVSLSIFNQLWSVWKYDETLCQVFDSLLKAVIILGEIQGKSSSNFMIIRIQTSFTVVISLVLSSWIINEFEKVISSMDRVIHLLNNSNVSWGPKGNTRGSIHEKDLSKLFALCLWNKKLE